MRRENAREPVVSVRVIPSVEVATAVTVLSAFMRIRVTALGFVRVKMLAPTVVAPRVVRAAAAVVAPVPPLVRARAWVRVRLLAVVVPKVLVPVRVVRPEILSAGALRVVPSKVKVVEVARVLAAVV